MTPSQIATLKAAILADGNLTAFVAAKDCPSIALFNDNGSAK